MPASRVGKGHHHGLDDFLKLKLHLVMPTKGLQFPRTAYSVEGKPLRLPGSLELRALLQNKEQPRDSEDGPQS